MASSKLGTHSCSDKKSHDNTQREDCKGRKIGRHFLAKNGETYPALECIHFHRQQQLFLSAFVDDTKQCLDEKPAYTKNLNLDKDFEEIMSKVDKWSVTNEPGQPDSGNRMKMKTSSLWSRVLKLQDGQHLALCSRMSLPGKDEGPRCLYAHFYWARGRTIQRPPDKYG